MLSFQILIERIYERRFFWGVKIENEISGNDLENIARAL
jgi:hypothetical protein